MIGPSGYATSESVIREKIPVFQEIYFAQVIVWKASVYSNLPEVKGVRLNFRATLIWQLILEKILGPVIRWPSFKSKSTEGVVKNTKWPILCRWCCLGHHSVRHSFISDRKWGSGCLKDTVDNFKVRIQPHLFRLVLVHTGLT